MDSCIPITLVLFFSIFLSSALGEDVICEELLPEQCAFAVSKSGKRCVVENYQHGGKIQTTFQCRTSEVVVERMVDWVETDKCVAACGADRRMIGISSDALLDPGFIEKLCSPECYNNCPNMIDLYHNLAAGEGVVLSHLCETRWANPIRAMSELRTSGDAAEAPSPSISDTARLTTPISVLSAASSRTTASSPTAAISIAPAASPAAAVSHESAASPDISVTAFSDSAVAPSDISEFSIDRYSDELDADPVPVPAESPAFLFDADEEDDADFI